MYMKTRIIIFTFVAMVLASCGAAKRSYVEAVIPVEDHQGNRTGLTIASKAYPLAKVDVPPTFQGEPLSSFSYWVTSQLVYPEAAKENGVQGSVNLWFVVDINGSVIDVIVLDGDPMLAQEAVRVVSSSPKWKPARKDGWKVPVALEFPVIFKLK